MDYCFCFYFTLNLAQDDEIVVTGQSLLSGHILIFLHALEWDPHFMYSQCESDLEGMVMFRPVCARSNVNQQPFHNPMCHMHLVCVTNAHTHTNGSSEL